MVSVSCTPKPLDVLNSFFSRVLIWFNDSHKIRRVIDMNREVHTKNLKINFMGMNTNQINRDRYQNGFQIEHYPQQNGLNYFM